MQFLSTITNCRKACFLLTFNAIMALPLAAQENSPYSRFGLGDVLPTQNILNRAMGGITAAYSDVQSVNFSNPASYSSLKLTTYDVGLDYNSRKLKTSNALKNFASNYLIPSYLNVGFPLSKKKNWGMNIGLKPNTRINYDLINRTLLTGIDSVIYNYKGTGGSYQFFTGMGYGGKHLSVGVNVGYLFGNKQYSTQMIFLNDTVAYQKADYADTTRFGGLTSTFGLQYQGKISKEVTYRFGATYTIKTNMSALRDIARNTFDYSANGNVAIDSIYRKSDQSGTIIAPGSFSVSGVLEKFENWMIGAEFNNNYWSQYRYYGQKEELKDSWTVRLGGQYIPSYLSRNYWSRVSYRVGVYYGTDFIAKGSGMKVSSFTFGFGLPVRRNFYTNQYTNINTSFEIGSRGSKANSVRESMFRFSMGFNLSDIWFVKRQYQ